MSESKSNSASQSPRVDASEITISGAATAEEVAAIVVLLSASGGDDPAASQPARPRSLWNSRSRAARPRLGPGPFAWQGSAMPR